MRLHARPWSVTVLVLLAGCGSDGGTDPEPQPENRDPTARIQASNSEIPAGDDHQTIITLDGRGSSDPDGDPLSYDWDLGGGRFEGGTGASDPVVQASFPGTGTGPNRTEGLLAPYSITLTVSDGRGGTGTATAEIEVGPPTNAAPTAQIVADPTAVPEGDDHTTVVTLDGSASSDPDGDALAFDWDVPGGRFVGGTDAGSETAMVTFPGNAPYTVTLTVTDPAGASDQAEVVIDLIENRPPTAVATADPPAVPEGDANQTIVTLDGSASSDPDGDPLTFDWAVTSGTFVNGTDANSPVAQVTFPGMAPYPVTLTVADGRGGQDQAELTIELLVNEPPVVVLTADPPSVPAGDSHSTVVTIDASDSTDPNGDPLTFDWFQVPSGIFRNGTTSSDATIQVTFPGAAPYEVRVRVSDGRGGTAEGSITIGLN